MNIGDKIYQYDNSGNIYESTINGIYASTETAWLFDNQNNTISISIEV